MPLFDPSSVSIIRYPWPSVRVARILVNQVHVSIVIVTLSTCRPTLTLHDDLACGQFHVDVVHADMCLKKRLMALVI